MDNPLEAQNSLYGEDGPPMIFMPEVSALHLEMLAPPKRSGLSYKIPGDRKPGNSGKKLVLAGEILAKIKDLHSHDIGEDTYISFQQSPCELPGDFPPELSFRSLAAYSLLRTLSIQLRLSPFTPNSFLRALYLPVPTRLSGEIHVALLRTLFIHKLKNMRYSYKSNGGGPGMIKRRQIDGIRWSLQAGDNLSYLDYYSWPLFYDDYCHLTADRLWKSYHGHNVGDGDDNHDNKNFIDFRNVGSYSLSPGEDYQSKLYADGVTLPATITGGHVWREQREVRLKFCEMFKYQVSGMNWNTNEADEMILSCNYGNSFGKEGLAQEKAIKLLDFKDSKSEDDYQDVYDDIEIWGKPKGEKKYLMVRKNATFIQAESLAEGTTIKSTQKCRSIPNDWSRITSLESSIAIPQTVPTQKVSKRQNLSPDPNWSRLASIKTPFFSRPWSPREPKIEYSSSISRLNQSLQSTRKANIESKQDIPTASPLFFPPSLHANSYINKETNSGNKIQTDCNELSTSENLFPLASTKMTRNGHGNASSNNVTRFRGGSENCKFTVPLNNTSNQENMRRSRGSRRALPMHLSDTSRPSNFPTHPQHHIMSQLQQHPRDIIRTISRPHQNFGLRSGSSQNYSPLNVDLGEIPKQAANTIISNETPQIGSGNRILYDSTIKGSGKAFVVPDRIVEVLNEFVGNSFTHAREVEEIGAICNGNDHSVSESNSGFGFENKPEDAKWLHFRPIKSMRSGLPYHQLPIEDKVCILEFLIDELLTVDAISAEFSKRQDKRDHHYLLYGKLARENEYQNLDNTDECVVCGREGDLLCCDGCVSSYHAGCLGISEGQDLPEGRWCCPECRIVDPCNYGSLHGGSKGSLDWFSLQDIMITPDIQQKHCLSDHFNTLRCPPIAQINASRSPGAPFIKTPNLKENMTGKTHITSVCETSLAEVSCLGTTWDSQRWKDSHFLVIHGFVFCRASTELDTTFDGLRAAKPYLSLSKVELESFISQIDDSLPRKWPLAQIPLTKATYWKFPTVKNYFSRDESVNPFLYHNEYSRAPISCMTKVGCTENMRKLVNNMTYESECNKPKILEVSKTLTKDFSLDAEIFNCLKTQTSLFDPFEILKGYMLKLEQRLKRSCMLNEFWEVGNFRSRSEVWVSAVQGAKSIRALCRLLLKLTNTIHAKAFLDCWFHSHVSRGRASDTYTTERNYKPLPSDWSEEMEKQKRKWEITPSKMILNLCSDDKSDLMEFASNIRSDIFIAKQMNVKESKRKRKKIASSIEPKRLKKFDCMPHSISSSGTKIQELGGLFNSVNLINSHLTQIGFRVPQNLNPKAWQVSEIEQENTIAPIFELKTATISNCVEGKVNQKLIDHASNQTESVETPEFTIGNRVENGQTPKKVDPFGGMPEATDTKRLNDTGDVSDDKSPILGSFKRKGKRSLALRIPDPLPRRRTRRRISSEQVTKSASITNLKRPKKCNDSGIFEEIVSQIENAKKQKILGLEKLLKGHYIVQAIWPIAGRRVFPTIGNIPPQEMKRIGRNAGSVVAANLNYDTSHEVAQVCHGHIWRKRVARCNRFEELTYLTRILESSLDRGTIQQCENQTRRRKTNIQKIIRCTMRNPVTGSQEHFLMNKKSLKGCWVHAEQVDLSSLILDLFYRRQYQKEQRLIRMRTKEQKEKDELEKELTKGTAKFVRKAKDEKIRKAVYKVAKLKKQDDTAEKKAHSFATIHDQKEQENVALSAEIRNCMQQQHLALSSHEMQVQCALHSWTDRGNTNILENNIVEIRKRTVEKLRAIMFRLQQCKEPVMDNQQILSRMFLHEKKASSRVKSNQDSLRGLCRSSSAFAFEEKSRTPQTAKRNCAHEMFVPVPNNIPNAFSALSDRGVEGQTRKQQNFGYRSYSQIANSSQRNRDKSIFLPRLNMNQTQSSLNKYAFASCDSRDYFGAICGKRALQNVVTPGGRTDKPFDANLQNIAPDSRNQFQVQLFPVAIQDVKKDAPVGASSEGDVFFTNIQRCPIQNQIINSVSQSYNLPSSLFPFEEPLVTPLQHEQNQRTHKHLNQDGPDHQFALPTKLKSLNKPKLPEINSKCQHMNNHSDHQHLTSYNHELEKEIDQQRVDKYSSITTKPSSFNSFHRFDYTTDGSINVQKCTTSMTLDQHISTSSQPFRRGFDQHRSQSRSILNPNVGVSYSRQRQDAHYNKETISHKQSINLSTSMGSQDQKRELRNTFGRDQRHVQWQNDRLHRDQLDCLRKQVNALHHHQQHKNHQNKQHGAPNGGVSRKCL